MTEARKPVTAPPSEPFREAPTADDPTPRPPADSTPFRDSSGVKIDIGEKDAQRIARGASFEPGEIVAGRFTIRRLLGKGGMGAVYEAEDKHMDGEVIALKTVLPEKDRSGMIIERFKREIHAARKVGHPNVCRAYDIGFHPLFNSRGEREGDVIFLTMEYLRGEPLSDYIRKVGAFSPEDAFPLIQQMAAGLEAIHGEGIVHRDFKSPNVMIVERHDGLRAVITDFGLARLTDAPEGGTITRGPMGSPAYMAPEQIISEDRQGKKIKPGRSTDVYALGVVIYEMMTAGRFPFRANTTQELFTKRMTEAPTPPRSYDPALDQDWEKVILKCLEREQKNRYQSAREVADALQKIENARSAPAPEPMIPPRFRASAVAAVLILILLPFLIRELRERDDPPPIPLEAGSTVAGLVGTNPPILDTGLTSVPTDTTKSTPTTIVDLSAPANAAPKTTIGSRSGNNPPKANQPKTQRSEEPPIPAQNNQTGGRVLTEIAPEPAPISLKPSAEPTGPAEPVFEIEGIITNLTGAHLVVDTDQHRIVRLSVDGSTVIRGLGAKRRIDQLNIGDRVRVATSGIDADGMLIVRIIDVTALAPESVID